jgi:uncharacterized protein involved in outer membrane biogenesis
MTGRWGAGGPRWIIWSIAGVALLATTGLLALAAFPVGLFQNSIRRHMEEKLGTAISIGSIERREMLSFTPTVLVHDLAIRQPSWAGKGDMVQARAIEARIAIWPLLTGRAAAPEGLVVDGLIVNLVRDAQGRANWEGRKSSANSSGAGNGIGRLNITDGRISLRDDKRSLSVAGSIASNTQGLRIDAAGRFHDAPARLFLRGGPIDGLKPQAPYPARLEMVSPLLRLEARGVMRGALNMRSLTMDMHAAAPSLKYLDDVIEAGLFGTKAIDLTARVRHEGRDWFIDRLNGRIGQSALTARADVRKRDGRTKIDADVHFSRFGFDDLSDTRGEAQARAVEARIGERLLPGTRINIAKVGPTDGVIRFRADRLLLRKSAFRSLSGVIGMEGKLLTIDNIVAGMSSGRMTGKLRIDQRNAAPHPRLTIDLAFANGRLETLMGSNDATGPLRGRVILAGTGDTIREALGHADGRAGLVVEGGTVKRTVAAVLGQDLGKAIGAALRDRDATVPLRCLAIGFKAQQGRLTPSPFVVDTGISVGQGQGRLSLATEKIALTIGGRARDPSILRLTDPIRVGGTFSAPTISAAGSPPGSKINAGYVVKTVGKSLGHALGIGKERKPQPAPAIDCAAVAREIL